MKGWIKMNKTMFIIELSKKLNMNQEDCEKINNVLEEHFLIGKKNKEIIIKELMNNLNLNNEEADNIYNTSMDILKDSLKDKLKHPFKSLN